jgi:hypothetical protein
MFYELVVLSDDRAKFAAEAGRDEWKAESDKEHSSLSEVAVLLLSEPDLAKLVKSPPAQRWLLEHEVRERAETFVRRSQRVTAEQASPRGGRFATIFLTTSDLERAIPDIAGFIASTLSERGIQHAPSVLLTKPGDLPDIVSHAKTTIADDDPSACLIIDYGTGRTGDEMSAAARTIEAATARAVDWALIAPEDAADAQFDMGVNALIYKHVRRLCERARH